MYNLIRLLSPGVKSRLIELNTIEYFFLFIFSGVAQQELLQYLEQGCLNERDEMLRLVGSLNPNEQNSLKPILLRLINEQLDIMKNQQGNSPSTQYGSSQEATSRSSLESWFGSNIYKTAYPRMPSGRVVSASDLEQARLIQRNQRI
jgi:hypothetical protein